MRLQESAAGCGCRKLLWSSQQKNYIKPRPDVSSVKTGQSLLVNLAAALSAARLMLLTGLVTDPWGAEQNVCLRTFWFCSLCSCWMSQNQNSGLFLRIVHEWDRKTSCQETKIICWSFALTADSYSLQTLEQFWWFCRTRVKTNRFCAGTAHIWPGSSETEPQLMSWCCSVHVMLCWVRRGWQNHQNMNPPEYQNLWGEQV